MEADLQLSAAFLLPQHCPSLSKILVHNPVFFRPLVVPNFNTLTSIKCALTSTDLSSLCDGLQQTSSLRSLLLHAKLKSYEELRYWVVL